MPLGIGREVQEFEETKSSLTLVGVSEPRHKRV